MISGALFAFGTSFDEVVLALFITNHRRATDLAKGHVFRHPRGH